MGTFAYRIIVKLESCTIYATHPGTLPCFVKFSIHPIHLSYCTVSYSLASNDRRKILAIVRVWHRYQSKPEVPSLPPLACRSSPLYITFSSFPTFLHVFLVEISYRLPYFYPSYRHFLPSDRRCLSFYFHSFVPFCALLMLAGRVDGRASYSSSVAFCSSV